MSAEFLAHLLGLTVGRPVGPFLPVQLANGVTLDYYQSPPGERIASQHYAFLVSDQDFDAAFARMEAARIEYFADPHATMPRQLNSMFGGRGLYFADPDGHWLELMTRPYE